MSLLPSIFIFIFVRRVRRTFSPFRMVFFYRVTTGCIFYISFDVRMESIYQRRIKLDVFDCLLSHLRPIDVGPQRASLPIPSTAALLSCLWSRIIFSSLPGSRLMNFYRVASSALLHNSSTDGQILCTYIRSHVSATETRMKMLL